MKPSQERIAQQRDLEKGERSDEIDMVPGSDLKDDLRGGRAKKTALILSLMPLALFITLGIQNSWFLDMLSN
ncbi:hypothetical protein F5Y18DRAFT_426060 [Xylariaceae sp. FL1019]|nr:hypothetical protein F5Y18DRAFT_426060 [Xylariaceae sp. FL1019]